MPTIVMVDPHDDNALRAWYAALRDGATAGRTAALISTYDALATSLGTPGPDLRRLPYAAVQDDRTVGALLLELPLTENTTVAQVEIDVPEQHRGRGIGTALWEVASGRAAEEGRVVFQTEIHVPAGHTTDTWPGARFARRLGFDSVHVEDHLAAALPIGAATLDALEASVDPAGYEVLSWIGPCPEEHLEAYAAMRTAMTRDVPTGELTHEAEVWDVERLRVSEERLARTYRSLVCMARTTSGEPAGYTLLFVPDGDPDHVLQDDTYVVRAHRGHRLATLLKARNLRQLEPLRGGRAWLHTWTADTNGAMQAVNARFGFTGVERTHEFELS